jgi:hypothetical protein
MRPAEHSYPIYTDFALELVVNSCYTEGIDRGHTHFEQGVDRFNRGGHAPKRGHLALCQFVLQPKHYIVAVIFAQGFQKQGLQIEIPEKELSTTEFDDRIIELRFQSVYACLHILLPSRRLIIPGTGYMMTII